MKTIQMALFLFALGCIVGHLTGCSPGPTVPAYCTNEALFTAALVRCVDASSTREQARECNRQVHERCGISLTVSQRSVAP